VSWFQVQSAGQARRLNRIKVVVTEPVATSRSRAVLPSIVVTVVAVVAANVVTAREWFFRWLDQPSLGAGWLLVVVAGVLAWRERRSLTLMPRPRVAGLVLIYLGFLAKLVGDVAIMPFPDRVGLYLQLVGLGLLWTGWAGLRTLWRAYLLLLAAIPIPIQFTGRLYPYLGEAALKVVAMFVEIAGFSVIAGGGGTFDALSGATRLPTEAVQMPFYFFVLALVSAVVFRRSIAGLMLLVVCALPVLVACNTARCVIAVLAGMSEASTGMGPVLLRWSMLPAALAMLLLIDRLVLERRKARAS